MNTLDQQVARCADHGKIVVQVWYRGPVVIRWRQGKQRRTAEGRTLDVALRRAVIAAEKNLA